MTEALSPEAWKTYIRQADARENWVAEALPCSICGKNIGRQKITIPGGRVCGDCLDSKIRDRARSVPLTRWSAERIVDILSSDSGVCDRLTILWRIDGFRMLFNEDAIALREEFFKAVASNMGFAREHAMDGHIRNASLAACIELGKEILPVILKIRRPSPWQYRANIARAAAAIDDGDERVRRLLQTTAGDPDANVRRFILHTFAQIKGEWVDEPLRNFLVDSDPLVREAAVAIARKRRTSAPASVKSPKREAEPKRKPPTIRLTPLEARLDRKFKKEELREIYSKCLIRVDELDHTPWTAGMPVKDLSKGQILRVLSMTLENKAAFDQLLDLLPGAARSLIDTLIWDVDEVDILDFSEANGVRIARISDESFGSQPTVSLDLDYFIFDATVIFDHTRPWRHSYRAVLTLDDAFRKIFRKHRPVPAEYNWVPVDEKAPAEVVFACEQEVLLRIPAIVAFIRKGYLRTNKSGSNVLVSALRQMQRTCGIEEFYPEEDHSALTLLRTRLMGEFMTAANIDGADTAGIDGSETLLRLFRDFRSPETSRTMELRQLLVHLKGMGYADGEYHRAEAAVKEAVFDMLSQMPGHQWISIDNVENYARYHQRNLDLFSRPFARRSIYCQAVVVEERPREKRSGFRVYASGRHYDSMIRGPLIRGLFFLLGAFGLMDLAYNPPENSRIRAEGKKYLSPWDGLTHVRINQMGRFLLGRGEKPAAPPAEEDAHLELDKHRLLVRLQGNDPMVRLSLEQIAIPVTESCYRVDFDSFLKDCASSEDVEKKIEFFEEKICREPPEVWNEFLDAVRARLNPVTEVNFAVFRLQPNPELLRLFATDETLKKLVFKAEAYHILVEPRSIDRLKKRLKAFGYILEQR